MNRGAYAILLYDGTCGFCARSVQFVLRHEPRSGRLHFASLQGTVGAALHEQRPALRQVDSLIWYEPAAHGTAERILVRSAAVLRVAAYLGGVWRLLGALGHLAPRPLRDAAYDWIARRRRALAPNACVVPTPEQRERFLDQEH